jgi:hypothetical protein
MSPREWKAVALASLALWIGSAGVFIWQGTLISYNTDKANRAAALAVRTAGQLAGHDRGDKLAIYATDYRICIRQMEVRASIIIHVRASNGTLDRFLPIFDCTPDLAGQEARRLSATEEAAYIKHFDHHAALAP